MPIVNFRAEPDLIAAADAAIRVLRERGDARSRSDHLRDHLRDLVHRVREVGEASEASEVGEASEASEVGEVQP